MGKRYYGGMKDHHSGSVKRTVLRSPKIPARPRLQNAGADQIVDDAMLESVHLDDVDLSGLAAADVHIHGAEITRGMLVGAELERLRLTDVRITGADWSNVVLFGSAWTRVAAHGAKLVGARLNESSFHDVSFEECIGELLQAQMATFERNTFVRCWLRGAIFSHSNLSNCVFDDCDLREADFSGANLAGADVRRSNLEDVRLGPAQLSGLIVTADQALYLASAMGLIIRA